MKINKTAENEKKSLGVYIHIPFCIKKCNYCDFLSFEKIPEEVQNSYFLALLREINIYSEYYGNNYYVDTVFIGGGTPSLVKESHVNDLISAVRNGFDVSENAEISVESNPNTLTEIGLKTYLKSGVNRLSIGAQSCDDKLLLYMGRIHSTGDFLSNYTLARDCGFQNINTDLMFGIPGQTTGIWIDTLEKIIQLKPEHISFYSLQLEEGTRFFSMYEEGSFKETDDETDRNMYHTAVEILKSSGYVHYEISNASKDGYQCKHNLKYWSMKDYLGIGLGAHSFIDGTRSSNVSNLEQYIRIGINNSIDKTSKGLSSPFTCWQHKNTKDENISDYLITVMRKMQGIELEDFRNRFGIELKQLYGSVIQKYRNLGLIEIVENRLRFTEEGIDLSNMVLAEFV
ncbi:MAG: radical SAM family heme chaperone HemW [Eubacteriales bacterium]|nr:radical SAM family heme chaperone HemW [Eubacteriales bacterium]